MTRALRDDLSRQIRIESIADHLDLVETIAKWHWKEGGNLDPATLGKVRNAILPIPQWPRRAHYGRVPGR